jgi:hypothetical protein
MVQSALVRDSTGLTINLLSQTCHNLEIMLIVWSGWGSSQCTTWLHWKKQLNIFLTFNFEIALFLVGWAWRFSLPVIVKTQFWPQWSFCQSLVIHSQFILKTSAYVPSLLQFISESLSPSSQKLFPKFLHQTQSHGHSVDIQFFSVLLQLFWQ